MEENDNKDINSLIENAIKEIDYSAIIKNRIEQIVANKYEWNIKYNVESVVAQKVKDLLSPIVEKIVGEQKEAIKTVIEKCLIDKTAKALSKIEISFNRWNLEEIFRKGIEVKIQKEEK